MVVTLVLGFFKNFQPEFCRKQVAVSHVSFYETMHIVMYTKLLCIRSAVSHFYETEYEIRAGF